MFFGKFHRVSSKAIEEPMSTWKPTVSRLEWTIVINIYVITVLCIVVSWWKNCKPEQHKNRQRFVIIFNHFENKMSSIASVRAWEDKQKNFLRSSDRCLRWRKLNFAERGQNNPSTWFENQSKRKKIWFHSVSCRRQETSQAISYSSNVDFSRQTSLQGRETSQRSQATDWIIVGNTNPSDHDPFLLSLLRLRMKMGWTYFCSIETFVLCDGSAKATTRRGSYEIRKMTSM